MTSMGDTRTMIKAILVVLIVFVVWFNTLYYHQALLEDKVAVYPFETDASLASSSNVTWQTYLISFSEEDVEQKFRKRNQASGFFVDRHAGTDTTICVHRHTDCVWWDNRTGVTWFPAVDGSDPRVLEEFQRQAHPSFPVLTPGVTREGWPDPNHPVQPNKPRRYVSPHVVGCFESHRRLLSTLANAWDHPGMVPPDAVFVFEEDAVCAHRTRQMATELISRLPPTWDLLFLGGKPFASLDLHKDDVPPLDAATQARLDRETAGPDGRPKPLFRKLACEGRLGASATGPFGPDGSRESLSADAEYWRTDYVLDTHAYAVNPKRIHRVLEVLEAHKRLPVDEFVPLDVALSQGAVRGQFYNPRRNHRPRIRPKPLDGIPLEVYLSASGNHCLQDGHVDEELRPRTDFPNHPLPWQGFYYVPSLQDTPYEQQHVWEDLYFPECPEAYARGLL